MREKLKSLLQIIRHNEENMILEGNSAGFLGAFPFFLQWNQRLFISKGLIFRKEE